MRFRLSFAETVATLFILLWAYTGITKLFDFHETAVQLGKSPLIGSMATFFAVALPLTELALVALLLFDKTKQIGLYLSLALITAFTVYLLVLLNYSYYIPCACGGIFGKGISWKDEIILKMDWKTHIYFNLFFVALGITQILFPSRAVESFTLPKLETA